MYCNEWKNQPVDAVSWATDRQKRLLKRIGIETVYDMVFHLPFRYENRRNIETIRQSLLENRPVSVIVRVVEHDSIFFNHRKHPKIIVQDEEMRATLVGFNRPYLFESMKIGKKYFLFGKFVYKFNEVQASSFDVEEYGEDGAVNFGKILPIYSVTEDMTVKEFRKVMTRALEAVLSGVDDELPEYLLKVRKMPDKTTALQKIHFPESEPALQESKARLAYEEFLAIQLAVTLRRRQVEALKKPRSYPDEHSICTFVESLPYRLTKSQERSVNEILADMRLSKPMCRLLQGDVGSGKTTVAAAAMIFAASNNVQSALMVPTETLAIQHYDKLTKYFDNQSIRSALLTGSTSGSERTRILEDLSAGALSIVVGTHALYSQDVVYKNLGLIVIDEQHKFGVDQRLALSAKGEFPDMLVMTATPIPRTLTLTLYGDLDVSLIDEMPADRKAIITKWIHNKEYNSMLEFVKEQVSGGKQAFFIYPLIDESNALESKAAKVMYERLQKYFKNLRLGMVHGRMKTEERVETMEQFAKGGIDILVSTTVIEVGIDIPNAIAMIVENAENFGLSQLHQLRGRVGRGAHQSYCFLVTKESAGEDTEFRMETMVRTNDGFVIAEEDLKLRGPGALIGVRQSGMPELQIADFIRDEKLLKLTKEDAAQILKADPALSETQNRPLKDGIIHYFPTDYLHSG